MAAAVSAGRRLFNKRHLRSVCAAAVAAKARRSLETAVDEAVKVLSHSNYVSLPEVMSFN